MWTRERRNEGSDWLFGFVGRFVDDLEGLRGRRRRRRRRVGVGGAAVELFALLQRAQRHDEPLHVLTDHMGRHVTDVQRPRQHAGKKKRKNQTKQSTIDQ